VLQLPIITRSCGPCRACCKPFAVPEVGKHDAGWCPKSTQFHGCTIYETRPIACKKFACIWLNGKGEENDRPDLLGVMMDMEDFQLGERTIGILHLWEIKVGAIDSQRVRQIAEVNSNIGIVVVYHSMVGQNDYKAKIRLSREYFTLEEVELFQLIYHN